MTDPGWPRIGVDIGGTKIAVGLVHRDGGVTDRRVRATPAAAGADRVLATVIDLVRELAPAAACVGIGAPGAVDVRTGTVRFATDLLPGWAGTPVGGTVESATGLRTLVDNDVNVLALGELRRGAAIGNDAVLYVSVGTGVGGALALGGRIVRGARGVTGELGHLSVAGPVSARRCGCGRTGHLEAVASGPAIEAAYGAPGPDLREIARRAHAGEARAGAVITGAAVALGRTLGGLVSALDPRALVLGGGVSGIGPLFTDPLADALRAEVLPPLRTIPVLTAGLGLDAPLVGAALLPEDLADPVRGRDPVSAVPGPDDAVDEPGGNHNSCRAKRI
ncbi:ROK family protein [Embleya hyalina]|uniref:Glucokinase n=1 Tax=Embleya hyalina TaxID=516124 RepID=A0A401YEU4_9ACTN|nr:ROK family protein [Embleya hyalina]GCD93122.1 glucokinase [Embleya hyalina]